MKCRKFTLECWHLKYSFLESVSEGILTSQRELISTRRFLVRRKPGFFQTTLSLIMFVRSSFAEKPFSFNWCVLPSLSSEVPRFFDPYGYKLSSQPILLFRLRLFLGFSWEFSLHCAARWRGKSSKFIFICYRKFVPRNKNMNGGRMWSRKGNGNFRRTIRQIFIETLGPLKRWKMWISLSTLDFPYLPSAFGESFIRMRSI